MMIYFKFVNNYFGKFRKILIFFIFSPKPETLAEKINSKLLWRIILEDSSISNPNVSCFFFYLGRILWVLFRVFFWWVYLKSGIRNIPPKHTKKRNYFLFYLDFNPVYFGLFNRHFSWLKTPYPWIRCYKVAAKCYPENLMKVKIPARIFLCDQLTANVPYKGTWYLLKSLIFAKGT